MDCAIDERASARVNERKIVKEMQPQRYAEINDRNFISPLI